MTARRPNVIQFEPNGYKFTGILSPSDYEEPSPCVSSQSPAPAPPVSASLNVRNPNPIGPPMMPPPPPPITPQSLEESRSASPSRYHTHRSPLDLHPNQLIRICLIFAFGVVAILITLVLLYVLLTRDPHGHGTASPASTSGGALAPPVVIAAHGLSADSQWQEFVFNFTTTNTLYEEQRVPPSGSLSDLVDDFAFTDVLTDYNVCCMHREYRLICVSRSVGFNHGNVLVDGEVDWDPESEEVFLRLLVNSDMLLDVECWMTGRYFKP